MKHFLTRSSQLAIIALLFIMTLVRPLPSVMAAEPASYSSLYISISDAIMDIRKGDGKKADQALAEFEKAWSARTIDEKHNKEKEAIDKALTDAKEATSSEDRLAALTTLTENVNALKKAENPVDEKAERQKFVTAMTPVLTKLGETINNGTVEEIEQQYKTFNSFWKLKETPVREIDMGAYGQIETQMSFMRIELANDQPNQEVLKDTFKTLKQNIDDFGAGKKVGFAKKEYSLQTLVDLIDDATGYIEDEQYEKASASVKKFITIWPNVESAVSTKNGSLYTSIESNMPIITANLLKDTSDKEKLAKQLTSYKKEIQLLQEDDGYSFWDAALILLREGLEALLIILALVAFLKKSDQRHMEKWIYVGAGAGIGLSAIAAIFMSVFFNSGSMDTNRELIEGYIGLIAAIMMLGVGIWMHSKSNIKSWNAYIAKQMNHAISKGSIIAMASISFLSVFREGAETLIFYAGIAPKMPTSQFILGIAIAIVILAIVAVVLLKASGKIPIHRFFAIATVLIYLLTFKIIGVSLHKLQLLGDIPTTVIDGLPIWSTIGFYPTVETILGQVILLILVGLAFLWKRRNEKKAN
ncbi:FTR1 family iron permease [Kurthia senegalensis]|uniref:FTR1 family iron permease n=1 Tax=Kurthia senegalensis TaxID=1033740 RepID=UPI000287F396|nr:FTR1 family protein [Kurthia senegalensis]